MNVKSKLVRVSRGLLPARTHAGSAAPVVVREKEDCPEWLEAIIDDVRDWEVPDSDQLAHAFDGYMASLSAPIEALEQEQQERILRGRQLIQRLSEIAPDLFEKALQRYPMDTGYYLEKEE
jgi:hypothetical protein